MIDLTSSRVVDNHCHVLEPDKARLDPIWLAREFFHGMADVPTSGVSKAKLWGATDELCFHFQHMGVVLTAVCQLARLFGCPADLDAVTAERNRRTSVAGLAGYAKMLYEGTASAGCWSTSAHGRPRRGVIFRPAASVGPLGMHC